MGTASGVVDVLSNKHFEWPGVLCEPVSGHEFLLFIPNREITASRYMWRVFERGGVTGHYIIRRRSSFGNSKLPLTFVY